MFNAFCGQFVWIEDIFEIVDMNPGSKVTSMGVSRTYCWWTKSCTTKDDDYPIIYKVLYIPGGAGFLPSTVSS